MITTNPLTLRAEDLVGSTRRTALLLFARCLLDRAATGQAVKLAPAAAALVATLIAEAVGETVGVGR